MQIKVKFTFERETKGAVRYAEVNDAGQELDTAEATIGTLYLRKSALKGTVPNYLTVIVETSDA